MVKSEAAPSGGGGHGQLRVPTPFPVGGAAAVARNNVLPPSLQKTPGRISRNGLASNGNRSHLLHAEVPRGPFARKSARSTPCSGGGAPTSFIPRPVYYACASQAGVGSAVVAGGRTPVCDSVDVVGTRRTRRVPMNPRINGHSVGHGLRQTSPNQSSGAHSRDRGGGTDRRELFESLPSTMAHYPRRRQQPDHPGSDCQPPSMTSPAELPSPFATVFHRTMHSSPPALPPGFVQRLERREALSQGRVEVMLRISEVHDGDLDPTSSQPFLDLDTRRKQLTVYEPTASSVEQTEERKLAVSAPKMFAFDAVFSAEETQDKVCAKVLGDVLPAVVNGSDACVFTYGYSKLGKSRNMFGTSNSSQDWGIVPCAISWLFKLIHEQRQKTGARFSVRVSAVGICGKNEVVKDLLAVYAKGTEGPVFSPGMYLREDHGLGDQLQNQSELRAPSAEKAGFYLDAALAAAHSASKESEGILHFVFTLHVYQYRVDKSSKGAGVAGGRSRLYLVDLCGCEKQSQVFCYSRSYRISMANLGNVILAIFNSQKHVPYKDSKLTQLLKEILGNVTCRAAMIAHISSSPAHYTDSLATLQLASRIHRLRHKKSKNLHPSSVGGSADEPLNRLRRRDGLRSSSSDVDCTSSSEQSCDTVIFVGPRERTLMEGVEVAPLPSLERRFRSCSPTTPASSSPVAAASRPSFAQIRRTIVNATSESSSSFVRPGVVATDSSFGPPDQLVAGHSPKNGFGDHRCAQNCQRYCPGGSAGAAVKCAPSRVPPNPQTLVTANLKAIVNPSTGLRSDKMAVQPRAAVALQSRLEMKSVVQSRPDVKPSASESWVDGPRAMAASSGMSNVTAVPKEAAWERCLPQAPTVVCPNNTETWIDGPRAQHGDYFLDDQKRAMIERWIDLQTSTFLSASGEDLPPTGGFFLEQENRTCGPDSDRLSGTVETEMVSNVDSFVSGDTEEPEKNSGGWVNSRDCGALDGGQWNDHGRAAAEDFYRHVVRHLDDLGEEEEDDPGGGGEQPAACDPCDSRHSSDDGSCAAAGEQHVPLMDSWVQVTEQEIASECLAMANDVCDDDEDDDHPLRVLSSESLAVSFADSSQMSWDSGLNAVRRAFAVAASNGAASALRADRSQISVGIGTEDREEEPWNNGLDNEGCWSYEALSVHSDPGSGVSDACRNRFGSRSLESLVLPDVFSSVFHQCEAEGDHHPERSSHRQVCAHCDYGTAHQRTSSSEYQGDRHQSLPKLSVVRTEDETRFGTSSTSTNGKTEMFLEFAPVVEQRRDDNGPVSAMESCPSEMLASVLPSPDSCRWKQSDSCRWTQKRQEGEEETGVEASPSRPEDGRQQSRPNTGRVRPALKTGMAFCCAIGVAQLGSGSSSSGGSQSPRCEDDVVTSEVLKRCQLSPIRDIQCGPAPSGPERPLRKVGGPNAGFLPLPIADATTLGPSGCRIEMTPLSPGTVVKKAEEDKSPYDSGTGSTSSSGKEEAKECGVSPGTSSGYGSTPRGSEGSCSFSTRDSASLSSEETSSPVGGKSSSQEQEDSKACDGQALGQRTCRAVEVLSPDLFELRQYEEADVERVERRRTLELSMRLRRQRAQISLLKHKRDELKKELVLVKSALMADPHTWTCDLLPIEEDVPDDGDASGVLEALARETKALEDRVNACKSRIMMMTSFDITRPQVCDPLQASVPSLTAMQSTKFVVNQLDIGCENVLCQLETI